MRVSWKKKKVLLAYNSFMPEVEGFGWKTVLKMEQ